VRRSARTATESSGRMTGYPDVILPIWLGGWPRFRKAVQKSRCGKSHQIGAEKRACIEWSGHLPVGRQADSYSGMRSGKFRNPAKSGYNKGTIRSDIRYLVVSRDVPYGQKTRRAHCLTHEPHRKSHSAVFTNVTLLHCAQNLRQYQFARDRRV
jgi:hypothetical protein